MFEKQARFLLKFFLKTYLLVEEKYYEAIDFLEEHGLPARTRFVEPIESQGIPSFVLVLGLFLAAAIVFLFALSTPPSYTSLEVRAFNALTNEPLEAFISISFQQQTIAANTSRGGKAFFEKIPARELIVSASVEGFQEFKKTVDAQRTRFFTARLLPLPSKVSNELLLKEIIFPPESEAPAQPLPTASPAPPTPSILPFPSPQPLREEKQWIELGQSFSFEKILLELKDASSNRVLASVSTKQGIASSHFIEKNKPFVFGEIEIVFLDLKDEEGKLKALFSFKLLPARVERIVSTKIIAPANESVLQTAVVEVSGTTFSNEPIAFVEVSTDGGRNWQRVASAEKWVFKWVVPPSGRFSLKARATTVYGLVETPSEETLVWVSPCKQLFYHGGTGEKIDLVFIPSNYSRLTEFKEAIDKSLNALFSRRPFAESEEKREKINVYYYAYGIQCKLAGDNPPLNRVWDCEIPKQFFEACSFADITAVLVNSRVRAGIGGNPFVQSAGNPDIFAHEAGHALFDLADRYCCDGGYWQTSDYPNLWANLSSCSDYARSFNASCREIGVGSWSEQNRDSLMKDLVYDFDDSDVARINFVLSKFK